jgi:hypothetical protein
MRYPHRASNRSLALVLALVLLAGCASKTVLVHVPPRLDMGTYPITGIVEFAANADDTIAQNATRRFQASVQHAQPGTRFIELGTREQLLDAVGARELDAPTIKKIGQKYGVAALFVGELTYSEPKIEVVGFDPTRLQGAVKAELKADMATRLMETSSGASVWSSSSWAKRQLGSVRVSADVGVSGRVSPSNPRAEMIPDMIHHLTHDFRPTSRRQRIE